MTHQILAQLRQLKLGGMASAMQSQQEMPNTYDGLSFEERLQLLLDQESLSRDTRKQERLIKQARFKLNANIQGIDYKQSRNITKNQIAQLAQADWITKKQNLLLTGPCGSGKTYLACSLGHSACLKGLQTRYYRLSRLFISLAKAKADGTYHKELASLSQTRLLIIDDWGMEPITQAQRSDLMEIMDDRHEQSSTLIISQLPVDQWYACIGDNTLADAILDRLVHNAHRLNLKGESMRKILGKLTESEHLV